MNDIKLSDCFEANCRTFLFRIAQGKLPELDLSVEVRALISKIKVWKLVHANLIHRESGKPFSHCWIEGDNFFAFDFTPGAHQSSIINYREDFYEMSRIPDEEFLEDWNGIEEKAHLFRYSFKDAAEILSAQGDNVFWGPWDFEREE